MQLKSGVELRGVTPELVVGMMVAAATYRDMGYTLTITSVLDSEHKPTSLHYVGRGFDARTKDINPVVWPKLTERLKLALGPQFDVVLEKDHIHIEFDPKEPLKVRGEVIQS